jgi:adenylate cyclase
MNSWATAAHELLLNILPEEVAEELKDTGRRMPNISTAPPSSSRTSKASPKRAKSYRRKDLVEELNTCFKAFDHIITARGIEKIKTIGDAYMCAGGLPLTRRVPPSEHVVRRSIGDASLHERTAKTQEKRDAQGLPAFEMRCGIHTGPVVHTAPESWA